MGMTKALMEKLMPKGYGARPEQAIVFTVAAWDSNCPQHIPQRFEAADDEKAKAGHQVQNPDVLVVDGRDPAQQTRRAEGLDRG